MKRRRVIALCLAIGASSFLGALLGNAVAGDHVPAGYVRTRTCAASAASGPTRCPGTAEPPRSARRAPGGAHGSG